MKWKPLAEASVAVILLLVFFFVPVLPYQSSGCQVTGGTCDRRKGSVSASYFVLG